MTVRTVSQLGQRSVMRQEATPARCHSVGCTSGERQTGQMWASRGAVDGGRCDGARTDRIVLEDEHVALSAVGEDEPFDVAVAHVDALVFARAALAARLAPSRLRLQRLYRRWRLAA